MYREVSGWCLRGGLVQARCKVPGGLVQAGARFKQGSGVSNGKVRCGLVQGRFRKFRAGLVQAREGCGTSRRKVQGRFWRFSRLMQARCKVQGSRNGLAQARCKVKGRFRKFWRFWRSGTGQM